MFELEVRKEYPLVHVPDPVLYRYTLIRYSAGVDEFDNPLPGPGRRDLRLETFKILKRTPKGVWIADYGAFHSKRFVNLTLHKKFACETKEGALDSYVARTGNYLNILNSRMADAKKGIILAQKLKEKL